MEPINMINCSQAVFSQFSQPSLSIWSSRPLSSIYIPELTKISNYIVGSIVSVIGIVVRISPLKKSQQKQVYYSDITLMDHTNNTVNVSLFKESLGWLSLLDIGHIILLISLKVTTFSEIIQLTSRYDSSCHILSYQHCPTSLIKNVTILSDIFNTIYPEITKIDQKKHNQKLSFSKISQNLELASLSNLILGCHVNIKGMFRTIKTLPPISSLPHSFCSSFFLVSEEQLVLIPLVIDSDFAFCSLISDLIQNPFFLFVFSSLLVEPSNEYGLYQLRTTKETKIYRWYRGLNFLNIDLPLKSLPLDQNINLSSISSHFPSNSIFNFLGNVQNIHIPAIDLLINSQNISNLDVQKIYFLKCSNCNSRLIDTNGIYQCKNPSCSGIIFQYYEWIMTLKIQNQKINVITSHDCICLLNGNIPPHLLSCNQFWSQSIISILNALLFSSTFLVFDVLITYDYDENGHYTLPIYSLVEVYPPNNCWKNDFWKQYQT